MRFTEQVCTLANRRNTQQKLDVPTFGTRYKRNGQHLQNENRLRPSVEGDNLVLKVLDPYPSTAEPMAIAKLSHTGSQVLRYSRY